MVLPLGRTTRRTAWGCSGLGVMRYTFDWSRIGLMRAELDPLSDPPDPFVRKERGVTLVVPSSEVAVMPFGIGPLELVIVLVIVLVIFGPKRLPGLGRSLGTGMREFKDSISGKGGDAEKDEAAEKPEGVGD